MKERTNITLSPLLLDAAKALKESCGFGSMSELVEFLIRRKAEELGILTYGAPKVRHSKKAGAA